MDYKIKRDQLTVQLKVVVKQEGYTYYNRLLTVVQAVMYVCVCVLYFGVKLIECTISEV